MAGADAIAGEPTVSKYTRKRCRRMILKTVRERGTRRPGFAFVYYLECGHSVRRKASTVKTRKKATYCPTCEAIEDAKQP